MIAIRDSTVKRFWNKVDKSGECWTWTASKNNKGYGQLMTEPGEIFTTKRPVLAHRMSWMIHFGAIPKDMEICHKCDNPQCVNPNHLFLGTHTDNMRDMIRKGKGAMNQPNVMTVCPEKRHWGERNGQAKLTASQVREIRIGFQIGYSMNELGNMYGITRHAIGRIVRRQAWAHIE